MDWSSIEGNLHGSTGSSKAAKEFQDELLFQDELRQNWVNATSDSTRHQVQPGVNVAAAAKHLQPTIQIDLQQAATTTTSAAGTDENPPLWKRACLSVICAAQCSDDAVWWSPTSAHAERAAHSLAALQALPAAFMTLADACAVLCTAVMCGSPSTLQTVLAWIPPSHLVGHEAALGNEQSSGAQWLQRFPP
jgi:hypothetical protein